MKSVFDFSGPSQIIAADRTMRASQTTLNRRTTSGTIQGINRANDERIRASILRDNRNNPFMPAILSRADLDESRRKFSGSNSRGSK